ncbi:MAG: amino acid ABC transporter permease [Chloroflexi bacterium CFX4]|nr:amino acid ABC transporter permease [Chloroflexi bacterium CFX4]MDL1922965.1 amino acid ABC transporter permease [Chloroflexi bacterium CFX3]
MLPVGERLRRAPWWALVALLLGILFAWHIHTDQTYNEIFRAILNGVGITIYVTAVAYSAALFLGLLIAFARLSKNPIIYQVATFYVEIVRGVPALVLLLYIAFVGFDLFVRALNGLGTWLIDNKLLVSLGEQLQAVMLRDIDNLTRATVALVIAYSPFISEIFRAGIESIPRGQMEAARSLGMGYWQAMRYVILPQAIRNVLPPLGNDLIAMLKDSSLVSVLGVREITGEGRVGAARSFKTFETYNIMAFLYLCMTLMLSAVVRWLERRTSEGRN